ncbi:hypothetical protein ASPBRDRAFT_52897 [Aspergillus brasiliensis CBS 101740]|uniref:Major facilitator superfamily (MFS) profile domain-containing protein n=1 Tax=Aspergillus brasiliensis (strain CBS 101740 / IMI 381727 / IBT 21946) TaxID=767769 RepID=A0A1L9UT47_ASPBC|nr:hypothetical protein ASPBRDRAFT_52897 [Aspergillus brasiliensis CBS 101740]
MGTSIESKYANPGRTDWGRWWGSVGLDCERVSLCLSLSVKKDTPFSSLLFPQIAMIRVHKPPRYFHRMDTGIIRPATVMDSFVSQLGSQSSTVHGLIVSSTEIGALIFAIGAALEAAAVHIRVFVVGRYVEGIGEDLYLGTLVVYICEISPPRIRGALTTGPQLLITMGSSFSWRTLFIILSCLATTFSVASLLWLTPSPRWLTLHGRRSEATAVGGYLGKSLDLFSKDVRTHTALAVFLMGLQQLSDSDGVLHHAPLLFQQAGLASSDASFFASGVSAIVIFAVTILALIWADRWGQRHSTIYRLYAGNGVHYSAGAGRWVVIVCIFIFAVIYFLSWAPQRIRASATSLAHGSNWTTNFLVALVTPILLSKSSFGAYFLFGGCYLRPLHT